MVRVPGPCTRPGQVGLSTASGTHCPGPPPPRGREGAGLEVSGLSSSPRPPRDTPTLGLTSPSVSTASLMFHETGPLPPESALVKRVSSPCTQTPEQSGPPSMPSVPALRTPMLLLAFPSTLSTPGPTPWLPLPWEDGARGAVGCHSRWQQGGGHGEECLNSNSGQWRCGPGAAPLTTSHVGCGSAPVSLHLPACEVREQQCFLSAASGTLGEGEPGREPRSAWWEPTARVSVLREGGDLGKWLLPTCLPLLCLEMRPGMRAKERRFCPLVGTTGPRPS